LTNRRKDLVRVRTQTINRLHRLLVDLVPTGAGRNLTAARAAALLGQVSATGTPAITRWLLAADLIADGRDLDRRIAAVEARINSAVAQSTTGLVELFGVAPVLAAKLLGEVGDIGRFPTKHHFAAHTGAAPLEASSGQVVRHRLSRAGDRKLNHALYLIPDGDRADPPPDRRADLLPTQAGRGEVTQGGAPVPEAPLVRCGLPLPDRRRASTIAAASGLASARRYRPSAGRHVAVGRGRNRA
jgi:transposase